MEVDSVVEEMKHLVIKLALYIIMYMPWCSRKDPGDEAYDDTCEGCLLQLCFHNEFCLVDILWKGSLESREWRYRK